MNIAELQRALHHLRLGGIAAAPGKHVYIQAQAEPHGAHRSHLVPHLGRTDPPFRSPARTLCASRAGFCAAK